MQTPTFRAPNRSSFSDGRTQPFSTIPIHSHPKYRSRRKSALISTTICRSCARHRLLSKDNAADKDLSLQCSPRPKQFRLLRTRSARRARSSKRLSADSRGTVSRFEFAVKVAMVLRHRPIARIPKLELLRIGLPPQTRHFVLYLELRFRASNVYGSGLRNHTKGE